MVLPADILIWRFQAPLLSNSAWVESGVSILNPVERERADRFHFAIDRLNYLYFHQTLRRLLSSASLESTSPSALEFTLGHHGKPSLTNAGGLHFNLSHSKNVGALAISRSGPVGIDLETVDLEFPGLEIAEQYFQSREIEFLKSATTASEQAHRFFKLWTAKEAAMKACGLGMHLSPLEIGIDFSVDPPQVSCDALTPECQLHTILSGSEMGGEIVSLVHFQKGARIHLVEGDTPLASPDLLL